MFTSVASLCFSESIANLLIKMDNAYFPLMIFHHMGYKESPGQCDGPKRFSKMMQFIFFEDYLAFSPAYFFCQIRSRRCCKSRTRTFSVILRSPVRRLGFCTYRAGAGKQFSAHYGAVF